MCIVFLQWFLSSLVTLGILYMWCLGRKQMAIVDQEIAEATEYDYLCLEWNCEFLAQCKKHGWFRKNRA